MIAIVLFTCNRLEFAEMTLRSLRNLKSSEPLWLHIADDGSDQEQTNKLLSIAAEMFEDRISVTNAGGRGYGASYNLATQAVHDLSDVILPLEDDWQMDKELNIDPIVSVLRAEIFGCVRMGYIGYTQPLCGCFVYADNIMWMALDPSSAEHHVFAGHPRLEHREWERRLGLWPEGMNAGNTEFAVCSRPESRLGVAWPVDLIHPVGDVFRHIGSYKAGGAIE